MRTMIVTMRPTMMGMTIMVIAMGRATTTRMTIALDGNDNDDEDDDNDYGDDRVAMTNDDDAEYGGNGRMARTAVVRVIGMRMVVIAIAGSE